MPSDAGFAVDLMRKDFTAAQKLKLSDTTSADFLKHTTAVFNDAQGTDAAARCGIPLVATDADPRELSGEEWLEQLTLAELRPEAMAVAEVREIFDSQRSTWQPVSAAISVPARARYLIAHCWAEIRRPDDPTIEQFSQGRFVDDVSIHVSPNEPEWR